MTSLDAAGGIDRSHRLRARTCELNAQKGYDRQRGEEAGGTPDFSGRLFRFRAIVVDFICRIAWPAERGLTFMIGAKEEENEEGRSQK